MSAIDETRVEGVLRAIAKEAPEVFRRLTEKVGREMQRCGERDHREAAHAG